MSGFRKSSDSGFDAEPRPWPLDNRVGSIIATIRSELAAIENSLAATPDRFRPHTRRAATFDGWLHLLEQRVADLRKHAPELLAQRLTERGEGPW